MERIIDYFCISHNGLRRSQNQDNYLCHGHFAEDVEISEPKFLCGSTTVGNKALFGVFDGMGGEQCGDVAAYTAAKTFAAIPSFMMSAPRTALKNAMNTANKRICRYTKKNLLSCMGTTASVLLFTRRSLYLSNIGDTSIFRLSGGVPAKLSYDHVAIAPCGMKPPLLQYLGIPRTEMLIAPHTAKLDFNDGDIYLICSDGLTDMVSEDVIFTTLASMAPCDAANELLRLALEGGGKDNITLILMLVRHKNAVRR